jgi:hypothetical protein
MNWSNRQLAIFDTYEQTRKNIAISATAGCLGIDTPILMYDGTIKLVQNIGVGDQVMGPDSTPRTVLQLHRGQSQLYKINPTKGDSWICNEEHILTVWDEYIYQSIRKYKNTKHVTALLDYSLEKVLSRKLTPRGDVAYMFLQRASVVFDKKQLLIDPYFMGLWFADGTKQLRKCQLSVNCDDEEISNYLDSFQLEKGNRLKIRKTKQKGNCWYYDFYTSENGKGSNPLIPILNECFDENKNLIVPEKYYINSRENQLTFLAGLLDGDGWLDWKKDTKGNLSSGCFEITTKYDRLKEAILFLCRSLGLAAYSKKVIRRIKSTGFEGEYNAITISGDLSIIPTKLKRKQAFPRRQIKSVLRTGFSIEKLEKGDWYGFTVDKDERFLLGDFTITHNSGKSSTIIECCKRTSPGKKVLFMAFNKSIAEELKLKVPERIEVNTFHAKGLKVLFYNFSFKMKLNENKCFQLARKILDVKDIPQKQQMRYLFELQDIWNTIRMNLLVDYEKDIPYLCIEKDIEFRDRMIQDIQKIEFEWSKSALKINGNKEFQMDFTDMLWLPYTLLNDEDFPKYDVVFLDEVQDQNVLQRELTQQFIKPKFGRLIFVGDEKQCIYQFSGSSVSNFRLLQNMSNTVVLPLDITYRCAKKIVEEAKKVFSLGIEAAPNAIDGIVRNGEYQEAQVGDFVLCRNNLPLIEVFIGLLKEGKKATIKGRDFGNALCALTDKINCIDDLERLKEEKIESLKEKGLSHSAAINNPSYLNLVEKCLILQRLYCVWNNMESLENNIKRIYTDETEDIVLSTIHKSKGLEADRVFFLNQSLIPSTHAITEEAIYSEYCLKFVAITRARKELVYCSI